MPPKKKKSAPKNSFYFYMLDYKAKREAEGVVFPGGLKDVAEAASGSWKGLDARSKRHYENMAERAKVTGAGGVRYNTQGQTYDEAEVERLELERKNQLMMRTIKNSVEGAGREGLKASRFYFIHVNHYGAMDGRFIPCEVAVLAYSVERGYQLENIFHEFIKNFQLPSGYTFKAKSHSEATHQCPLPPVALGTCQIEDIVEKIWKLMQKNGDVENGIPPPMYTLAKFLPECIDFFAFIDDAFSRGGTNPYRIYPLEDLFFQMKNFGLKPEGQRLYINGIEDKGFPFRSTAEDILKGDVYDYAADIACKFHDENDVRQHCSRSYVIRWSYLFSDSLCANLDVKMKRVSHSTKTADLHSNKISTCMEQLHLGDQQGRNVCYGRGRPVQGHISRPAQSWGRGQSGDSSLTSLRQNVNAIPATVADYSEFQDNGSDNEENDDFEPLTPKYTKDDAPLRQPKMPVKSSMMLDAMYSPSSSETESSIASYASHLGNSANRGRGRGLCLPSGRVIDDFDK